MPEVWRGKREDGVDKGENTEKGRALRNAAQKKRDTNLNVKEQKRHDCPMEGYGVCGADLRLEVFNVLKCHHIYTSRFNYGGK